jgi:hypothetical protein
MNLSPFKRRACISLLLGASLFLAACGGGGGGDERPPLSLLPHRSRLLPARWAQYLSPAISRSPCAWLHSCGYSKSALMPV